MEEKALILDEKAMGRAVSRIAYEILERNKGAEGLCLVGILSRGRDLARRVAGRMAAVEGADVPWGALDITRFRGDHREDPGEDRTDLPFDITGKRIVLVDDVIYTGRTVRAAIDALFALGRPQSIQLAALVDRGHRELPIRADYVGKNLPTSREETVRVLVREVDGEDRVVILE